MKKRCTRCKRLKLLHLFNKDCSTKTGLDAYCRLCNHKKVQEYRSKTKNYRTEKNAMLSYIRELLRVVINKRTTKLTLIYRIKLAEQLYKKLLEHPRCPYTNEILIPKVNLNLDHVIPISRGGNHTIHNLEWISKRANWAKSNMTPKEFLDFCKLVIKNTKFNKSADRH